MLILHSASISYFSPGKPSVMLPLRVLILCGFLAEIARSQNTDGSCLSEELFVSYEIPLSDALVYGLFMEGERYTTADLRTAGDSFFDRVHIKPDHRRKIRLCNDERQRSRRPCNNYKECRGHGMCYNPDPITDNTYPGDHLHKCQCDDGYTGKFCEHVINNCLSLPCKNWATCENSVNNFTCNCWPGWNGRLCDKKWLTEENIDRKLAQIISNVTDDFFAKLAGAVRDIKSMISNSIPTPTPLSTASTGGCEWERILARCQADFHKRITDAVQNFSEVNSQEFTKLHDALTAEIAMMVTTELSQQRDSITAAIVTNRMNITSHLNRVPDQVTSALSQRASAQRLPKYRVYVVPKGNMEASKHCQHAGGGLALIKTREEQNKVADLARKLNVTSVWYGAIRSDTNEPNWVWWDGSEFTYTDWPNMPSNRGRTDCLFINLTKNSGTWTREKCITPLPYVCQFY